jgi:acetoin utilization protein AcuC
MFKKSLCLIHSSEHANWVFDSQHPTQGRRYINAQRLLIDLAKNAEVEVTQREPRPAATDELSLVHSQEYIKSVISDHMSGVWSGERKDLSSLASLFVGGTLLALELLISEQCKTAIHFPGAKHHAQHDYSSGFCVFNDLAIAAEIATKIHHKKVAILDIDGHHGDGTENLTRDNPDILTYSIHHFGIFPGTGQKDHPEFAIYNDGLNYGDGDEKLKSGVERFIQLAKAFKADILFLAVGADGHAEDDLTGLKYSVEGITGVCSKIRYEFPSLPILMGGAGGYLPDTRTPEIWANAALALANS